MRRYSTKLTPLTLALAVLGLGVSAASAQPPGRGATKGPPRSPREAAPIDLTGYWVSVISEDWRWRMVTPAKDDFAGIPFTPEGRKVGDAWDPAKDQASGACFHAKSAP